MNEHNAAGETENVGAAVASTVALRAQLEGLVPLLRGTRQVDPTVQRALADLIEELIRVIDPNAPAAQAAHLAESSTHLAEALHHKHHPGLIEAAKERLEGAAARAEAEAPVATGLARRLIDTLANLGI